MHSYAIEKDYRFFSWSLNRANFKTKYLISAKMLKGLKKASDFYGNSLACQCLSIPKGLAFDFHFRRGVRFLNVFSTKFDGTSIHSLAAYSISLNIARSQFIHSFSVWLEYNEVVFYAIYWYCMKGAFMWHEVVFLISMSSYFRHIYSRIFGRSERRRRSMSLGSG